MPREQFSLKLITFLAGFDGVTAYGAILGILLACGLGIPVPEDITLVASGILAGLGTISLTGAIIVGLLGVIMGDAFLFFLGRIYGHRVFKLPVFRTIFTEDRINASRNRILNNSKFICFFARFLPGLRAPIFLTAGIMGVRPLIFLTLDGIAALISVPFWIVVGFYLGDNLDATLRFVIRAQKSVLALVAVVIVGFIVVRYVRRRRVLAASKKPVV